MTLSKFLTILGITSVLVAAQVIGLPNQKPKVAQAHCTWKHPHHCKPKDVDPTQLIPGSKKVAEEAWGEAGRGMYRAAAEFMSRDNSHIPVQSLDSRQKELLRPEFGSLVDKVTVQYGADMMDRWGSGKFQISQGSAGQTFCNKIYIQAPYKQNDYGQLILLAHELQHSRQCENLGGMSNFGYRYFKEFKKAGQSYANNSLEREAETVANRVQQYVDSQLNVGSQSQGTPSQQNIGYFDNGATVFYSKESSYCGFASPNHLEFFKRVNSASSLGRQEPSNFGTYTGACPLPSGYFDNGAAVFFTAGNNSFCGFPNPQSYDSHGRARPQLPRFGRIDIDPNKFMNYTGICQ